VRHYCGAATFVAVAPFVGVSSLDLGHRLAGDPFSFLGAVAAAAIGAAAKFEDAIAEQNFIHLAVRGHSADAPYDRNFRSFDRTIEIDS
jgi:hypothetical protein